MFKKLIDADVKSKLGLLLVVLVLSPLAAFAQLVLPALSPQSIVSQKVGLTEVTVNYSRPSVRGRKIYGGVVPYGQAWRTGANAATKISFKDEVSIEGYKVPAGDYALYTIPGAEAWTIVLNTNTKLGANMAGYKEADDVARFQVKAQKLESPVETFTINFNNLTTSGATIELLWEQAAVRFKLDTDTDTKAMNLIREQTNPKKDANTYYQAASYYFNNNKDLAQALEWVSKSADLDPKYWVLGLKANIQAKLKDYKGAVSSATKAVELAKAANNNEFVRSNEQAIEGWKKQK